MSASLPDWAFAGLSDTGLQRATNQDSYYLSPAGNLFIVADGMGGHAGGQEASRLTTAVIEGYLHEHWESDRLSSELLEAAVLAANDAVLRLVETQQLDIDPGDRLLLCSYGLTEELSSDAIIGHMQSAGNCEEAVLALIEAAKAQGGRDNITAIALAMPR